MMVQDDLEDTHTRCLRCGRRLTDKKSREYGLGPVCKKKLYDDYLAIRVGEILETQGIIASEARSMDG